MKCLKCERQLKYRFDGGKKNPKNYGKRGRAIIILLACDEHGKFCCGVEAGSVPYQTKARQYVRRLQLWRPDQIKFLKTIPDQQEYVRTALDKKRQADI